MSRNYTDEQVDKMMENILNNEQLKNKMLKDFGFDVKDYSDEDMGYILCAITEQGGLKDKVKAAKALYIVDQIAKFACMHDKYQDVGGFTMDLVRDCGVLHFNEEKR